MKFTALLLLSILGVAVARDRLKCFECDACAEFDYGTKEKCGDDEDVCMKVIAGNHVARMCQKLEACGIGKLERASSRAWDTIANVFREVDRSTPLVYCCDDDLCNSSDKTLPSLILTILPLLVIAFFKN